MQWQWVSPVLQLRIVFEVIFSVGAPWNWRKEACKHFRFSLEDVILRNQKIL
jgi:hypothetical protein